MSFQEFVLEVSLARKCIDPANSVAANYGYVYSLENITANVHMENFSYQMTANICEK